LPEIVLGRLLELLQHHRRYLGRAVLFAFRVDDDVAVTCLFHLEGHLLDLARHLIELTPDEALDRVKRVFRIGHGLSLCDLTDQPIPVLCKCDDRRSRPSTLAVCDYLRLTALHHGNDRVGRSEVNSDDLAHNLSLQTL
jgi:hypothetical protein